MHRRPQRQEAESSGEKKLNTSGTTSAVRNQEERDGHQGSLGLSGFVRQSWHRPSKQVEEHVENLQEYWGSCKTSTCWGRGRDSEG